jgi:hypothetical protein
MKPSERIAARITPHMDAPRLQGYAFDPITIITIVIGVVRLLIMLWKFFHPDHARRRLEHALEPGRFDYRGRSLRRKIAAEVRRRLPDATERDVDAIIKGLADCNDQDLLAVRAEAWEGTA